MLFAKAYENMNLTEEVAKDKLQGVTQKAYIYLSVVIPLSILIMESSKGEQQKSGWNTEALK